MRLLPEEEWPRLFELFADSFPGKSIPLPPAAACAVIEEEGEIRAAVFFIAAWHMEPAMAQPGYGPKLRDLGAFMEQQLLSTMQPGESLIYYVTAPDSPEFIEKEQAKLGRTPMFGFVPMMKQLIKE